MKKYFLCILLFLGTTLFALDNIPVSFSVRYLDGNEFEVSLEWKGDESGTSRLILPSAWASEQDLYKEISGLECLSENSTMEDTEKPEIKTIRHLVGRPVKIRYRIHAGERSKSLTWYFRPQLAQSHFLFVGSTFFAYPAMNGKDILQISLEWKDFPPDWNLANSFGAQQKKQTFSASQADFLTGIYAGGDFKIFRCGEENNPIFVAVKGEWEFSPEWLKDRLEKIIYSQRQFWNDTDYPYYLVTVFPTGVKRSMGGTCLKNAFSLFIGDLSSMPKKDWEIRLSMLISHEHFHNWNGHKIRPKPPQEPYFWFSEGFTEYFSTILNVRQGVISFDEWAAYLNEYLYEYYSSPVRGVSNDRIVADFWNDFDVSRLPYLRGFFLAMRWSGLNEKAFDDAMRLMLLKGDGYSREDIEQAMGVFLGDQAKKDIQQYIFAGEMVPPIHEALGSSYSMEWTEDAGFNLRASQAAGAIIGVRENSLPFKAGLKRGQKLLSFDRKGREVAVEIIDLDGQAKEVLYTLDENVCLIPQYVLKI